MANMTDNNHNYSACHEGELRAKLNIIIKSYTVNYEVLAAAAAFDAATVLAV